MRKTVIVPLLLAGCSDVGLGSREAPVINGTVDNGDPAVIALMDSGSWFCSGTLITPTWVLTAAHCLEGGSVTGLEVFFGTDANTPSSGDVIDAKAMIIHPDYGQNADIGLVELASPSPVTPAARNTTALSNAMAGEDVRVVGFGLSEDGGDAAGVKRTGTVRFDSMDADYMMVTPLNMQSGCYGDSGGPNFMTFGGTEVVAGVTSFGTEDSCLAGLGGNTDVQQYEQWIDDTIGSVTPPPPACGSDGTCNMECTADPDCAGDPGGPGDPPDDDEDSGDGSVSSGGCTAGGGGGGLAWLLVMVVPMTRRRHAR